MSAEVLRRNCDKSQLICPSSGSGWRGAPDEPTGPRNARPGDEFSPSVVAHGAETKRLASGVAIRSVLKPAGAD